MSYFPCDIPFMSEDEKKKNGIKCNSDVDKDINVPSTDTISRQATITEIKNYERDSTAPINYVKIVEQMPPAQPERIQNNAVHLCDSCQYTYVTCPSHGNDAVFGDGKGNDNICACNKYRPIYAQPERKKGKYTVSGENAEWYCWYATCNECGKEWMGSRNFCPNCGADMRQSNAD